VQILVIICLFTKIIGCVCQVTDEQYCIQVLILTTQ